MQSAPLCYTKLKINLFGNEKFFLIFNNHMATQRKEQPMSNDILEKIYKASDMSGGVTDIVVFTQSFKAFGNIVKDTKDNMKHILTLKNASICHHFDECSCNIESPKYEWLNINEDKIIAFSILGYLTCQN